MSLQKQIRDDMIMAMKSRDTETVSLLRVVAGEFGRVGKEVNDEQALKVLRKMSENAKELKNQGEIDILDKYLPKMFDENIIRLYVEQIIQQNNYSQMKDMGKVMGDIKKLECAAQIDGKIASNIVKELLSK